MGYLVPLLLGGITKLYDDISDHEMEAHAGVIESFKSVLISLFTLACLDDFYFSFTCILLALLNCGIDSPFWQSIAVVAVMLTIRNLPLAGDHVLFKLGLTVMACAGFLVGCIFEDRLFPEEVSVEKIFFRVMLIIGFMVAALCFPLMDRLQFPEFAKEPLQKGVLIMLAYATVSVCMMVYLWYYSGLTLEQLNVK